ncbi:MAG TPA: tRNA pseudouridine(13) synthase TruD [Candidatus Nanoarchaeia archaeon]|nr:tRNA pseudouridine(13) synthase TruD [Candidatus Nanoarchaeia archaeon]
MYKFKELNSDFIVEEVIDLKIDEKGRYSYFLLKKENRNTLEVINRIIKVTNINKRDIGYAGLKDRNAITKQFISTRNINNDQLLNLKIDGVSLTYVGKGNLPITLGSLKGNKFKIIVRDLDKKGKKTNFLENYFDDQRFSIDNARLGKDIVLGKRVEEKEEKLRLYLNSYRAFLFNKVLAEYLSKIKDVKKINYSLGKFTFTKKKFVNFKIPLIAFDTELKGDIGKIYEKILKEEGLEIKNFLTRSYPNLVEKTVYRDALVEVKGLKIRYLKDEIFKVKLKADVEFFLTKGSYGTLLIKKIFN